MKTALFTSAIVGIVFGIIANHGILLGSSFNLVVWAVVGILIGLFIEQKKYIKLSGLSYGFFLGIAFMVSGFGGTSDKIFGYSLFTLIISIIGALCGWMAVFLGNWIKNNYDFRNRA